MKNRILGIKSYRRRSVYREVMLTAISVAMLVGMVTYMLVKAILELS